MGATNALKAYLLYAGKVPPLSMQILAYMALVSIDADAEPWYSQGHASLAEFALGRPGATEADIRAVERAITPLLQIKAISTDRPAARRKRGSWTAKYRLHIDPAQPVDISKMRRQKRT